MLYFGDDSCCSSCGNVKLKERIVLGADGGSLHRFLQSGASAENQFHLASRTCFRLCSSKSGRSTTTTDSRLDSRLPLWLSFSTCASNTPNFGNRCNRSLDPPPRRSNPNFSMRLPPVCISHSGLSDGSRFLAQVDQRAIPERRGARKLL